MDSFAVMRVPDVSEVAVCDATESPGNEMDVVAVVSTKECALDVSSDEGKSSGGSKALSVPVVSSVGNGG
jgi:hypothetical protein